MLLLARSIWNSRRCIDQTVDVLQSGTQVLEMARVVQIVLLLLIVVVHRNVKRVFHRAETISSDAAASFKKGVSGI